MSANLPPSLSKLYTSLFVFLAFALQIQISFFASESYKGLRFNLADTALPFIGIFILYSLISKTSLWPEFHIKNAYLWLFGIGVIFIASLVHGYILYDQWSNWGLVNKIIGWFILTSYFLLGGWLAHNTKPQQLLLFIKTALYFFITISTILCFAAILQQYGLYKITMPLSGLMANKNAFIFLTLSLLSIATLFRGSLLSARLVYFFWFLLPIIFAYTGARAGLLAFPILFILPFLTDFSKATWAKIVTAFILGALCIAIIQFSAPNFLRALETKYIFSVNHVLKKSEETSKEIPLLAGDSIRLKILDTTFKTIKDHPILGAGLGSAKIKQEEQWGAFINIIDCTPLWLWAETGLVGLSAFLIFYALILRALWRNGRDKGHDEIRRKLSNGVLLTLLIFGVMCLFHEILYTRFLWFFLGLALAAPFKRAASNSA